jgi:hypothetical protein
MLDKHLKEQIDGLVAIQQRLAEFGTEHEGIWIYGGGDDDEREYRQKVAEVEAAEQVLWEEQLGVRQRRTPQYSEKEPEPDQDNNPPSET